MHRDLSQIEIIRKLAENGISLSRQTFRDHRIKGIFPYDVGVNLKGNEKLLYSYEEIHEIVVNSGYGKIIKSEDHTLETEEGGEPNTPTTLVEANTFKSIYQGKLQELKFKVESGELVERSDIENKSFLVARVIRDKLLAIPERISSELSTMDDAHAIRELLYEEFNTILENLSAEDLYQ